MIKTNGLENEINDKMIVRQITLDADFIKQFDKYADLKNISTRDKTMHLKLHKQGA